MMMAALPLISLWLRLFGYKRTRRVVDRLSQRSHSRIANKPDLSGATHLARLAAIAGRRGLIESTCLRQALLVYGLLRRRGLQPELKFGVRRTGGGIEAHAWVELEGIALAQARHEHSPFPNPATPT